MPNIALVVLDTLRKDAFDRHFDWLPGTRFENAWSTSHWTVPAHTALFGGKYASELGGHAKSESTTPLPPQDPVLAERLGDAGYRTRAVSCNAFVSEWFGFDRGFETFESIPAFTFLDPDIFDWETFISETQDEGLTRFLRALWQCGVEDCDTVASLRYGLQIKLRDFGWGGDLGDDGASQVLQLVDETTFGDREFLFVNLIEAHSPYDPPADFLTGEPHTTPGISATVSGTDVDPADVARAYDDSVRYLSYVYEQIFAILQEEFDYVITLADHGELLGEGGGWAHSYGLAPELTHVPLVVSDGSDDRSRCEETVSILDVHMTVLELAGVASESRGEPLVGDVEGRPVMTEYHGLSERKIHRLESGGVPLDVIERYDEPLVGLATPEDYYGYESQDGFVERGSSTAPDPCSLLEELRDDLDVRDLPTGGDDNVPEDVRRQLEYLGYA